MKAEGRRASAEEAPTAKKDAMQQMQGDQPDEQLLEKYRCIINRLRTDIRYFFFSLGEFVDLSPELVVAHSWETYIQAAEKEVQEIATAAFQESVPSVEAIVALLNLRDKVLLTLIDGEIYQQAVLDSDLKRQRASSDERAAYMAEHVRALASKAESLPERYVLTSVPNAHEPDIGLFTYDKSGKTADGGYEPSSVPARLQTLRNEMQGMEKDLRHIRFGTKITVPDKHNKKGKSLDSHEMRKEITRHFDKCSRLEHELQTSKAQRHTPWEQRIEHLNQKLAEKDLAANQTINRIHRLEGELANLKADYATMNKELQELNERNHKVTKENLPVLEAINRMLADTWAVVDRLTADAEMLSSMFKLQVGEYQSAVEARDAVSAELTQVQRSLKSERLKNTFKEEELQKKDTLYQRTVVARQDIHDSYLQQKESIKEVEERQRKHNERWQEMLQTAEDRNAAILRLRHEVSEANREIDLLEQQKKGYTSEFKRAIGRPCGMLLQQCKPRDRAQK